MVKERMKPGMAPAILGLAAVGIMAPATAMAGDGMPTPAPAVDIPEGALYPACAEAEGCFDPYTITVEAGTEVAWTNRDAVLHTVTDAGGAFDNQLLPGGEFTFTFDDPGTYMYNCMVYPWAGGMVVEPGEMDILESTQPEQGPAAATVLSTAIMAWCRVARLDSTNASRRLVKTSITLQYPHPSAPHHT